MKRGSHRLGFAASLLIHGGLLGGLWLWQQAGSTVAERDTVVPIALAMFAETAAAAAAEPVPEPEAPPAEPEATAEPEPEPARELAAEPEPPAEVPPASRPMTRPTPRAVRAAPRPPVPQPRQQPAPARVPSVAAAPPAAETAAAPIDLAALRNRYKRDLLAAIARQRFYPARARRRGLEGQVQVRFRVQADGTIGQVELVASSGVGLLDRAALRTLQRLGKAAPLPAALGLSHWDLQVPIDYRLL